MSNCPNCDRHRCKASRLCRKKKKLEVVVRIMPNVLIVTILPKVLIEMKVQIVIIVLIILLRIIVIIKDKIS